LLFLLKNSNLPFAGPFEEKLQCAVVSCQRDFAPLTLKHDLLFHVFSFQNHSQNLLVHIKLGFVYMYTFSFSPISDGTIVSPLISIINPESE